MGNCLVTKLKGVVDNDNLPYFDSIIVTFSKASQVFINTNLSESGISIPSITLEILEGNGYLTDPAHTQNYGQKHTYEYIPYILIMPLDNDPIKVRVSGKSSIIRLVDNSEGHQDFDMEQLEYCDNLAYLNVPLTFTVGQPLPFNRVKNALLKVWDQRSSMPLSDIIRIMPNLEYADQYGWHGNITQLAALPNLTSFYASSPFVTGDIVDFISAKRTAGVTSGTINLRVPAITVNGRTQVAGNKDLTWDATSFIFKIGNLLDGNTAYVYNITAEQRQQLIDGGWTNIIDVTEPLVQS